MPATDRGYKAAMERSDQQPDYEAEGMPDQFDGQNEDEGQMPPGEGPRFSVGHGTTPVEQMAPETVRDRLAQEQPEVESVTASERLDVGRLVEPGSDDVGWVDEEKDVVAAETGDDAGLSAEEAAMHVIEET